MNKEEILRVIPHRYPMLFVDDIEEVVYKERVRGVKKITASEPWAEGHFPGNPVFPGALTLETMSQIGCFVFYHGPDTPTIHARIAKIEEVKFIKAVLPGDTLVVEGTLVEEFDKFAKIKVTAKVGEEIAAKGVVTYYFIER